MRPFLVISQEHQVSWRKQGPGNYSPEREPSRRPRLAAVSATALHLRSLVVRLKLYHLRHDVSDRPGAITAARACASQLPRCPPLTDTLGSSRS
jgi:hypothetical protein